MKNVRMIPKIPEKVTEETANMYLHVLFKASIRGDYDYRSGRDPEPGAALRVSQHSQVAYAAYQVNDLLADMEDPT